MTTALVFAAFFLGLAVAGAIGLWLCIDVRSS